MEPSSITALPALKCGGKLSPNDSLELQLQRFVTLRHSQPEKCKRMYDIGEELVTFASRGQLQKLRSVLENAENDFEILLYHSHKMFLQALIQGHLIIAGYLIDSGFPFRSFGLPCPLHEAYASVDDYRGEEISRFLVDRGLDVNFQEGKEWLTPLHVAVKYQLFGTIQHLLSRGADVNAIARHDIMPLNLAQSADDSSIHKASIVKLLVEKGARSTWRRPEAPPAASGVIFKSFSGGACSTESTSCVFKNANSMDQSSFRSTVMSCTTASSFLRSSSAFQCPDFEDERVVNELADALSETKVDNVRQFTRKCLTFSDTLEVDGEEERPGQMFSTD